MVMQRRWMYLESIFTGSDDIRQQLPAEATRFDTIDRGWGSIMADTARNTLVLDACSAEGRCARGGGDGGRLWPESLMPPVPDARSRVTGGE
jgi:hypothetical protein